MRGGRIFLCFLIVFVSALTGRITQALDSPENRHDVEIDLSFAGEEWEGMVITVPQGTEINNTGYSILLSKGDGFQVEVNTGSVDLGERKTEIRANTVNRIKRIVVDHPDALVYSSDVGIGEEWHFISCVKIGDADFYCEDVKGLVYTKADVENMFMAARSLRRKG